MPEEGRARRGAGSPRSQHRRWDAARSAARRRRSYANVTYRLFSEPRRSSRARSVTHAYTVFAGPKRPDLLAEYYAADDRRPTRSTTSSTTAGSAAWRSAMVGLLHVFYGVVGNYGIAIIMLTVLVRGCMFPISRGQAKSMAKLQELRPEMERIKEKYKGDQQKQAQAMQQLYRKHNVNPLGGCLPMLIQLPIFIGLYRGLAVDVELRQAPLFGDSDSLVLEPGGAGHVLRLVGLHAASSSPRRGLFRLGPYLNVLPLVTIGLFLLQQKMFMPEPANEQAAMQQKIMKYMMVFMGILFYKVPSGLCLYFIASSLWGIGERKLFPPPTRDDRRRGGRRRRRQSRGYRARRCRQGRARRRQEAAGAKNGASTRQA